MPNNSCKLWSGEQMITQNDNEMNFHNWTEGGSTKLYPSCSLKYCLGHEQKELISLFSQLLRGGGHVVDDLEVILAC